MSERSERGLKKGVSIYFMRKGERAETGASLKGVYIEVTETEKKKNRGLLLSNSDP